GSYGYWRDQGIYIQRGEKQNPVLILEPGKEYVREDGSIGTYYNAKKMYDISQTTEKRRVRPQMKVDERQLIRALTYNPPVSMQAVEQGQLSPGEGARFVPEERCIVIQKGMEAPAIFQSVTRELAHAQFAQGSREYNRKHDTLPARSVSYLLCKKYGVDTQGFDFNDAPDYLAALEPQEIRQTLSKIRDAASDLASRMSKVLEPDRSNRVVGQER
ncbi:hypothetical protein NE619_18010, partial [Anaerovorax odorimutans]